MLALLVSAALAAEPPSDASAVSSAPVLSASYDPSPGPPNPKAARARALYFREDPVKAAAAFEEAVKVSSSDWTLWADGAIAWSEAGRPDKAVEWTRRGAALTARPEARASLGWALLRADDAPAAAAEFERALAAAPDNAWALLGAGRAQLALGRAKEAIALIRRAADAAPGQSLADYYLGQACEAAGDEDCASEAYRRAVGQDSFFHEGRGTLARSYLRLKRHREAWKQLQRLIEADPGSRMARTLLGKVKPLLGREEPAPPAAAPAEPAPVPVTPPPTEVWGGRLPAVRVGVSSTGLGKPRPRRAAAVRGNGPWKALDPKTKRLIARAEGGETWTARITVTGKGKKKRSRLTLHGPGKRLAAVPGDAVAIVPEDPASSLLTLVDDDKGGRAFRGELELALAGGRRTIRVVNTLGLEDYTHGVVSAEMPVRAPLEALKAQAVVARTHALYIITVTKRHRKDGYDLCDEQHCQVYGGQRAETPKTRSVVDATRGQAAMYEGRPAHVIYSSHCGGSTQSGTDIGWGRVPYWDRVTDAPAPQAPAASPLELRLRLSRWPAGFCRPSSHVYGAHARWTRAIPAKDLSEKLDRKLRVGTLKALRVLRRAPSGHVQALLVVGSKRSRTLRDEMEIRSLLGTGSLRGTYFVVDTEYRRVQGKPLKKGAKPPAPAWVPETFVFRGGGWGHGVGMCQSGAMGRAEAGYSFADIVAAYFPGVTVGSLGY